MFWGVLFFAFVVMVCVLSGVAGGGWFWGAEGLGAERLGFWGVFSNARGGGPVVVVRGGSWSPGGSSWWSHTWRWSRGGGAPLVVVVWWSRGGGPVVVVRGGGLVVVVSVVVVPWWLSRGGGLVVVVSWWSWSRGGGPVVVVRGRTKVVERAIGVEGQVVPQQWLAHTIATGATANGGALCNDAPWCPPNKNGSPKSLCRGNGRGGPARRLAPAVTIYTLRQSPSA